MQRDGKPGLADFVRYVAASTSLRSSRNDTETSIRQLDRLRFDLLHYVRAGFANALANCIACAGGNAFAFTKCIASTQCSPQIRSPADGRNNQPRHFR